MTKTIWVSSKAWRLAALAVISAVSSAFSVPVSYAAYDVENLDRGVVAVTQNNRVFISWRWLGQERESVGFNVYRSGTRLNSSPITDRTNFIDAGGNSASRYSVAAVVDGLEQPLSAAVAPWSDIYLRVPLQRPAGGRTPDGVDYDYSPNDASVADLDGDGAYEIVVKWDPSNAQDNSKSGYTGNVYLDAYELDGTPLWRIDLGRNIRAGAHYTQFIAYDLDSDGRAEVACRTSDGTVDGGGNVIGNGAADYRTSSGYVLSGPEYLTVFEGASGRELASTNYVPARGRVSDWGDNYGNRVDRFLAGLAWLDGEHPSLIMSRGYYTRAVVAAWDWRNGQLSSRWVFDSDNGYSDYRGQGAHSLSIGDVDADGRDEIVFGAATIDDNGYGLYSTGLGHGDALHLSDMDPNRPGLEVYMVHETPSAYGEHGSEMHDAATGRLLWGVSGEGSDVGRGVAMDIDPRYSGYEAWASRGGLYAANGTQISSSRPSPMNFGVYWDGDLGRELLDGTKIDKWDYQSSNTQRLLTAYTYGAEQNNTTKANPALSADIFGDWREEVIWRANTNDALLIFTSTIESPHKVRTLMHDPQYRAAVAWQNVGYNQPPHPSFFLGFGMATPPMQDLNIVGGEIITPPLPSVVLVAGVSASSIALSWSVDNVDVTGLEVYRDTDADPQGRTRIASVSSSSREYTDTDVVAGETYYYWIKLTAGNGEVVNSRVASASVPKAGIITLVLEEETAGFCGVDGGIESEHAGFIGSGYANTANALGAEVEYAVRVLEPGDYRISVRYANGATENRNALLLVDGGDASRLSLPSTGEWFNYGESDVVSVNLSAGEQRITLQAEADSGLPNIDSLSIIGVTPMAAGCSVSPLPQPTPIPTPVPTVVPTPLPTPVPTSIPTPEPTPIPTVLPAPLPTPIPTTVPAPGASTKVMCEYTVASNWGSGFVANIRITNSGSAAIDGWQVNWQYSGGSRVTSSWNARVSGSDPYSAINVAWNNQIAPGAYVEFGFQGVGGDSAEIPEVSGDICP